jgi:hypothetical protein
MLIKNNPLIPFDCGHDPIIIIDEENCPAIDRAGLGGFLLFIHDRSRCDDPPVKRAYFIDAGGKELLDCAWSNP